MTEWVQPEHPKPETWGLFLQFVRKYGICVETHQVDSTGGGRELEIRYLKREADGQVLYYPMPDGCVPDRRMGIRTVMNVCERLRIPEPPWTLTL